MNKYEEYTNKLINLHGITYSLILMEKMLEVSKRTPVLYYFDEAEFTINNTGHYELPKNNSNNKKEDVRERRVENNINFYSEIVKRLRSIQNGKSTTATKQ